MNLQNLLSQLGMVKKYCFPTNKEKKIFYNVAKAEIID